MTAPARLPNGSASAPALTPGPWRVSAPLRGFAFSVIAPGPTGGVIGVCAVEDGLHDGEAEVNASLIASAPDLLASLSECVEDLESAYDDGEGARPTAVSAAIHRARAALAKAKGGAA